MDWKRTGNKEYPEENQTCLVYFAMTGFTISKFSWDYFVDKDGNPDKSLGKIACFSDRGGYLGDEDVLWMPMPEVPDSYKNDKYFKKWDDPEKVYKYVELISPLHFVYYSFEIDVPQGAKLGIISERPFKNKDGRHGEGEEVWQCVWDDGNNKQLIYVDVTKVKEIS